MFREPTLERTLRTMKNSVQYKDETTSKEDALRSVAEESAVADVLAILEEREGVPGDLRRKGIDVLIDEFESEFPDFGSETPEERRESRREAWREWIRNGEPGDWKDRYEDGIGPGVFTVECTAESGDAIESYVSELFPDVNVRVLNYQVSRTPYGRTRVIFRLDGKHSVDRLPDHHSVRKLRDFEDSAEGDN